MTHDEYLELKRKEILEVAQSILAEQVHPIEGIRRLNSLRHQVDESENEIFETIVCLDSESDTFPLGEFREKCAPEYLARKDNEMADFIAFYRTYLVESCHEILNYFSGCSEPTSP